MAMRGIPFLLFQPSIFNPPSSSLAKRRKGGFMDSKRRYLTRRLFQFPDLVWKISLDDQGPKVVLEKKSAECRWLMADRKNQIANTQ
jgi:hypothetical protein